MLRTARPAAALILALAACGKPPPPGVERIGGGAAAHDFSRTPDGGRVLFLERSYPEKTYLSYADRGGARGSFRLPGRALCGPLASLDGGRRALVGATKIPPDQGRIILTVDVQARTIVRETPVPNVSGPFVLSAPSWSPKPVAIWPVRGGVWKWSTLGDDGTLAPKIIENAFAEEPPLICPDHPWGAALSGADKQRVIAVYDFARGAVARRVPAPPEARLLRASGDSLLYSRWSPEDETYRLERLDVASGRSASVWSSTQPAEAVVDDGAQLLVVTRDRARPADSEAAWLAPRRLTALDADSGQELWSQAWTNRAGAFLGREGASGRLLFAVTDRDAPALWLLPAGRAALAAAAPFLNAGGQPMLPFAMHLFGLIETFGGLFLGVALIKLWRSYDA